MSSSHQQSHFWNEKIQNGGFSRKPLAWASWIHEHDKTYINSNGIRYPLIKKLELHIFPEFSHFFFISYRLKIYLGHLLIKNLVFDLIFFLKSRPYKILKITWVVNTTSYDFFYKIIKNFHKKCMKKLMKSLNKYMQNNDCPY